MERPKSFVYMYGMRQMLGCSRHTGGSVCGAVDEMGDWEDCIRCGVAF